MPSYSLDFQPGFIVSINSKVPAVFSKQSVDIGISMGYLYLMMVLNPSLGVAVGSNGNTGRYYIFCGTSSSSDIDVGQAKSRCRDPLSHLRPCLLPYWYAQLSHFESKRSPN